MKLKKSLGLANSCVYYAHQTREVYQVLPYSVDSNAPEELWDKLVRKYLSHAV